MSQSLLLDKYVMATTVVSSFRISNMVLNWNSISAFASLYFVVVPFSFVSYILSSSSYVPIFCFFLFLHYLIYKAYLDGLHISIQLTGFFYWKRDTVGEIGNNFQVSFPICICVYFAIVSFPQNAVLHISWALNWSSQLFILLKQHIAIFIPQSCRVKQSYYSVVTFLDVV